MPNSIKQFFHAVKGYLIHLGVEVYTEKCKQHVKLPKIRRIRKESLTRDILARILSVISFKLRIVFLVELSSCILLEINDLECDESVLVT